MLTLGYPLASSGLQGGIALSQGLKTSRQCWVSDQGSLRVSTSDKKGDFSFASPRENAQTIMLRYKRGNLPRGIVSIQPRALQENVSYRTYGIANRYPGSVGLNG